MSEEVSRRLLFVDDEERVLQGLARRLRKKFDVETALKGPAGLVAVRAKGPFAVVISDLRMPGMDGIAFLSRLKEMAPDTVRMLLSGNADFESAMGAVNEGNIFRILSKPCPDEVLVPALESGIAQYRLVHSERQLLEETLRGSVKTLSDVLALANPQIFGRAMNVKHYVGPVLERVDEPIEAWPIEVAVMLSQIGAITLDPALVSKLCTGREMDDEERAEIDGIPVVSEALLGNIPRLEPVRDILRFMHLDYDGGEEEKKEKGEEEHPVGDQIPWGSRLLRILFDYESLRLHGATSENAVVSLKEAYSCYDQQILAIFDETLKHIEDAYEILEVGLRGLRPGMLLVEAVTSRDGQMLVAGGQEVTTGLLKRLASFRRGVGVTEPIRVRPVAG